jgi:phage FluMu protein Com
MSSSHSLDIQEPDPRQPGGTTGSRGTGQSGDGARPALQVYFKCANAYLKVLRSADGSGYTARCPRCGIVKNFIVGSGGIDQRTFVLTCE